MVLLSSYGTKTIQKKVDSLNKKGASIKVVDTGYFQNMLSPSNDQVLAMMRGGDVDDFNYVCEHGQWTITGENFDGADLSKLRFWAVRFHKCSFVGATLSESHFSEAQDCDFSKAKGDHITFKDVNGSRFRNAWLKNVGFSGELNGADLSGATLEEAHFSPSLKAMIGGENKVGRNPL